MFKISVMYPNLPGTHFNMEYYVQRHMPMVVELMKPEGLVKIAVDKGISVPGALAPYHCIGQLFFDDPSGYDRALLKHRDKLRGDIPNFTDTTPVRQISDIVQE